MDQSPIVGYLKVSLIGILICVVFLSVMSASKTEEKIVRVDESVHRLSEQIRDMSKTIDTQRSYLDRLEGANETLLKLLTSGRVRAPTNGPGGPDVPDIMATKKDAWGWHLNAALDADLDPKRPLGTPGRYKNFLTLDADDPEGPENPPNTDGVINRPWGSEPKGFNLMIENYGTLSNLVEQYCLSRPGRRHKNIPTNFSWKPVLAWRVEVSPDYSEYTFFLRRDIYWQPVQADTRIYPHLGGKHPVTAHDYKFSYDIMMDEQSLVSHDRAYYKDFKDIEVVDDHTFVMRWKPTTWESIRYSVDGVKLQPKFVYGYDQRGRPYPKETVAQEFNDHWYDQLRVGVVGTGPYRFKKYETGKYIELERWDDWFGFKEEPLYAVKTLHYKIYNQPETQMTWLRTGEIDIGGLSSTRYRDWVLEEKDPNSPFKNGDIITKMSWTTRYLYIAWKNTDPMFADKRVRQALTYACDRQTICDKIWLGRFVPMSSPLWPPSDEADPNLKPYPFDPEKSKKLLDEAGWKMNRETGLREKVIDGRIVPFRFKLHWPGSSPEFQNMLDHYKNDLLKIGIQMEPLSMHWAQFQKETHDRKFVAFSALWSLDDWHHDFKQIWHSRMIKEPGSSNYIEYSNPELDRLSDKLDQTFDIEKRKQLAQKIGRILYEDQPYTFFGWNKIYYCHSKRLKNWKEHAYKLYPLSRTFGLWVER